MGITDYCKLNKTETFGLDIGSSGVRMVQLEKARDGYNIKSAALADIDARDLEEKEVEIIRQMRKCYENAGITTEMAVSGISGQQVSVRPFEFPHMPANELVSAVRYEASQSCPFDIEDCSVSYQVLNKDKKHIRGIFVAAYGGMIKEKQEMLNNSSLKLVLLDVDGLALLNCLECCEELQQDKTHVILKVDTYFTNISIMNRDSAPFVRDIPIAGLDILTRIANNNGITKESARQIWVEGDDSNFNDTELYDILTEAGGKLVKNINDTLKYFSSQSKIKNIDKIFVCGSFAKTKGFIDFLKNELKSDVVLWNPLKKMNCRDNDIRALVETKGPEMAVAAGLALRTI